jgi:hypothetical protein
MYNTKASTTEATKLKSCCAGVKLGTTMPVANRNITNSDNGIMYLSSSEKNMLTTTMPTRKSVSVFLALWRE